MPLRHSGGNAARDREADLRRRVCRIASTFLNGRPWSEVLGFSAGLRAGTGLLLFPTAGRRGFLLSNPGPQDPQGELPEPPERAAEAVSTKPVFFDPTALEAKRARRLPTRVVAASAATKVQL
jgi:hypothetical protein